MNTVRIGIVGIGNIGTAHAECIYRGDIKGLTLSAVCDIDPKRIAYCKSEFAGVSTYSDFNEMLEKEPLDALLVSTPHKFHSQMAIAALKAGLNVLVEKPEDVSVTKALELNRIAKDCGKVFAIMFNQRTNPLFKKARDIVQSGELGEIKRTNWIITNWYRTQKYYDSGAWRATWSGEGGGVLLNQAPHNLDLWQWICGEPREITAFCDVAKFHNIEVEDDVTIFARYKNGATGTFITTTGEYPGTNRLEISGNRGKIVIENGHLKLWKLSESERKFCFDPSFDLKDLKVEYSDIESETSGSAHAGILQNFTNAILFGEELISPGYDGIYELSISNAAYLSQWKGNVAVKIPFDCAEFDSLLLSHIANTQNNKAEIARDITGNYLNRWNVNW